MGYFRKALGLARPHWPYFSLAFACLAVSKAASIALPNFTGGVIDRRVPPGGPGLAWRCPRCCFFGGCGR